MSDLFVFHLQERDPSENIKGIFFPNAILGIDHLLPNKGLMMFVRKTRKDVRYSIAESVLIGPDVEFKAGEETPVVATNLYIATTRVDIYRSLLPTAYQIQFEDPEYQQSIAEHLEGEVGFVELPQVHLSLVGLNREKILELCSTIPELTDYISRHKVIQLEWSGKKIQLVVTKEDPQGFNAVLIDMKESLYLPSAQNVRFVMKPVTGQKGVYEYYLATDNALAFEKLFAGVEVKLVEEYQRREEFLQDGLPARASIYQLPEQGMKIVGGFIMKSCYEADVRSSQSEALDEAMKLF
ncbi:MAG: hypothetical protein AB7J40_05785 [Candidatus Altimarinota bacterium]